MADDRRTSRRVIQRHGAPASAAISGLVGLVAGLAASALILAVDFIESSLTVLGESSLGSARFLVTVPIGLAAAWFTARRFAPEVSGDGVPETMAALAVHGGRMRPRTGPMKLIATVLTVAPGGSAGREGPIVQIGASIGSTVSSRLRLGEDQMKGLVAAGAGAGVGAAFNAPIAGMLFAMEVILGTFSVRHLSSVVVASVAAAVTTQAIVGEERLLSATPHTLSDPRELILYAGLGLVAAVAAFLFLRMLDTVETSRPIKSWPSWIRPIILGLFVGGVGYFEPTVMGTGQQELGRLLSLTSLTDELWWILLGGAVLKMVVSAATLGAKASGGAFMPSLFIGASLGAGFVVVVAPIWDLSVLQPGAFAVVGMAATFAAIARAPLTSILIVFEITGDYGLVLPLMLATGVAVLLTEIIHKESAYTMPLARRGIRLTPVGEVDVLDTVTVGEAMSPLPAEVTVDMTTAEVQGLLDRIRHHGLPVTSHEGRLAGIITVTDIVRAGGPSDQVTAGRAMTPRPITVSPDTTASVALERMAALGIGRIPVVSNHDPSHLVGIFRREDAVAAYHLALSRTTAAELRRESLRQRTDPGARFFDVSIPPGSIADGRAVREVPWPAGVTVVAVRRDKAVEVPNGDTRLVAGDVITAFAGPGSQERLVQRLSASTPPDSSDD